MLVFFRPLISILMLILIPNKGVYNTSKAAMNLLSESLRVELAPFDVQVITVITGVIKTEFFSKQTLNLPKGIDPLP